MLFYTLFTSSAVVCFARTHAGIHLCMPYWASLCTVLLAIGCFPFKRWSLQRGISTSGWSTSVVYPELFVYAAIPVRCWLCIASPSGNFWKTGDMTIAHSTASTQKSGEQIKKLAATTTKPAMGGKGGMWVSKRGWGADCKQIWLTCNWKHRVAKLEKTPHRWFASWFLLFISYPLTWLTLLFLLEQSLGIEICSRYESQTWIQTLCGYFFFIYPVSPLRAQQSSQEVVPIQKEVHLVVFLN